MSETVSVSVSGAAFSLLFYENIKSEHDQDGFLMGSIVTKETNKLTDADHRVVNRERIINVKSVLPCPQQFYFYEASGKVNNAKIASLLGDQSTNVVGWFIFKRKRASASKFTLREKIIHKQLADFFGTPMSYFSCCLLTLESSNNKSTYSFCQSFVRYHMAKYESLPLHVINLSDPSYSFKSAEPVSDELNKIVKSVKNTGESEGHQIVRKVQDALQSHMKTLVEKTAEKEQELFKLEQEVKQLKYNLKWKREYDVEDKDDTEVLETTVVENGTPENSQTSTIESPLDSLKKKRGRPRKQGNTIQNSVVSSVKNCDTVDDNLKESEIVPKSSRSRPKTNISYSEMAQKKKN